jgi:hypothetical protein
MLMVEIGSWTRDLCLEDPISRPLHNQVQIVALCNLNTDEKLTAKFF